MIIHSVDKQKITDTPHKVDVRRMYDQPSAQVMHMTLHPGQSLKPHITPVDVFFYVLEGVCAVQVGEETIDVGADHLVESPKDIVHCLSNNSDALTRILVVKAPRPEMKAKMV